MGRYGQNPNVMFETFNEPKDQDWGSVIKPYHEQLVPVIRQHSSNLIVLGTKTWSQRVDEASWNKVSGSNLAYTLHFYANTHRGDLRQKATTALNNGIALFVTEWGTCSADGNGQLDLGETQTWLNFLKQNSISDANWAIGDKSEACAALKPGASASGGWPSASLTTSGNWMRNSIRTFSPSSPSTPTPSPPTSGCSKADTNRFWPDLGGCCSGLAECKEARPTSDSVYCPVGSAGHGSTCWSTIDMCRSSCGSSPTPSPPTPTPSPPTSGSCQAAWNNNAGGYTCGFRIQWLQNNRGMTERQAKNQIAVEFKRECGACGTDPACDDKHPYCFLWSQNGLCRGTWQSTMQHYCPRSCGHCSSAASVIFSAPHSASLWEGLDQPAVGPKGLALSSCFERFPTWLVLMTVLLALQGLA